NTAVSVAPVLEGAPARRPASGLRVPGWVVSVVVPILSVLAALGLWELISRTEVISQRDLPAMSTTVQALWDMVQTAAFWTALGETVRGWAIGLGLAAALAIPLGIALCSRHFAGLARPAPVA